MAECCGGWRVRQTIWACTTSTCAAILLALSRFSPGPCGEPLLALRQQLLSTRLHSASNISSRLFGFADAARFKGGGEVTRLLKNACVITAERV